MRDPDTLRALILAVSLAGLAASLACTASAQPAPGAPINGAGPAIRPSIPMRSGPLVPPRLSAEEAETFKKSMAAYEQCTRDQAAQVRLSESADSVISLREKRAFWESEITRNSSMRLRYPQGYEQALNETFNEYRSSGGSASTVEAVQPVPSPCTNPWESYRGPRAPLIDRRQIPIAPR